MDIRWPQGRKHSQWNLDNNGIETDMKEQGWTWVFLEGIATDKAIAISGGYAQSCAKLINMDISIPKHQRWALLWERPGS